jgi:hypothetical protein
MIYGREAFPGTKTVHEEARRRDRRAAKDSTISPRAPGPNRTKGTKAAERVGPD